MVPEDQLSILLASALNSSVIKASLFYRLKGKEKKTPEPFNISVSTSPSVKVVENLDHVQAIWAERASPVALSDSGHALLPHLISWESICACSSREGGHELN